MADTTSTPQAAPADSAPATTVQVTPDGAITTKAARIKQAKTIVIWSLVALGALLVISKLTDKKVPIVDSPDL